MVEKNEYEESFAKLSDEEIVETFNSDTKHNGWVAARGRFLSALRREFIKRGFDTSEIIKGEGMSMMHRVKLEGKKLVKID